MEKENIPDHIYIENEYGELRRIDFKEYLEYKLLPWEAKSDETRKAYKKWKSERSP